MTVVVDLLLTSPVRDAVMGFYLDRQEPNSHNYVGLSGHPTGRKSRDEVIGDGNDGI